VGNITAKRKAMSLKRGFTDSDIRNLLDEESEEDDLGDENKKLGQKKARMELAVERRKVEKKRENDKIYKDTMERVKKVDKENNPSTTKEAKIGMFDPFEDIEDRSVARVKEIMKRKKPTALCSNNPSPTVMANYIIGDLKVVQLKAQMKARGLKTARTKDTMMAELKPLLIRLIDQDRVEEGHGH
jgi:hypothetical protein